MEFLLLSLSAILLIAVVFLWFKLPFIVMGTNKRLDIINDNILASQKSILEVQKDILSCLKKMSTSSDTDNSNSSGN